jgi:17beta-estradiol 17-dehydrogenase / very-long-chain 3-oxoacyl-CoA reductase
MFGWILCLNYYVAWMLGIYTFVHSTCFIVRMVIRNYARKSLDLPARYGKGSWAVVTGATGGIGEEYCVQLAKLGFNVVLMGRNKERLEESEKKVKEANQNVKTKIVLGDLGTDLSAKYYQGLYDQIKDLDISILVNNAGWTEPGMFELQPMRENLDNYRVMCASPAMLTRFMINKLLDRKERSAIINVSSVAQAGPIPYIGVYSAAKRFLTLFSYHLYDNYKHKIDVQDLQPGFVHTKICQYKVSPDTISTELCVQTSFRDLGQELSCFNVVVHSIPAQVLHLMYRFMKPVFKLMVVNEGEKNFLKEFLKKNKKDQ